MANEIKLTAWSQYTTDDFTFAFKPAIDALFDSDFANVWHGTQTVSTSGKIIQVGGTGENPYLVLKNHDDTNTIEVYVTSTHMIQLRPGGVCCFRQARNIFAVTTSGTAVMEVFAAGSEGLP
jgi:hypothetical protein